MPQRATDERSRWPESVFTFPESVFNLPGMRVHLRPESVFKIVRNTQLTAPGVFDGAIDGESFRAYIEQILVPTLQPSDIVIADNLGAHKVAGIQRAIQAAGATLWYLPPYSPDLNPIELCFAKLKALVRTARCRSSGDALAVPRYLSRALQP